MTPDDQYDMELDFGPRTRNENISEDVHNFLEVFDIPKVSYKAALEACNEMFRPLQEEINELEDVVRKWCA